MSETVSEDNFKFDPDSLSHLYWWLSVHTDSPAYRGKPRRLEPSDEERQYIWQRLHTLSRKGKALKGSRKSPMQFSRFCGTNNEFCLVDKHETGLYKMCEDLSCRIERTVWFMNEDCQDPEVLAGVLYAHVGLAVETAERIQDSTPSLDGKEAWVHEKATELVNFADQLLHEVDTEYE